MEGKLMLFLAVCTYLPRSQQLLQVSMSPNLRQIFLGDSFYLSCDNVKTGNKVTWLLNDTEQTQSNDTWKIEVASSSDTGSYKCQSDQETSPDFKIEVLKFVPSASLTIKTGHPVMQIGTSVILQLNVEEGLSGWICRVYRRKTMKEKRVKLGAAKDLVSWDFQTTRLDVPETIYWCTKGTELRSNQITIRTSGKPVFMEMNPLPVINGESLTLTCLAWGSYKIQKTVFYKDDTVIPTNEGNPTHEIQHSDKAKAGRYKCDATFTYIANPKGEPHQVVSDYQNVFVQEAPVKALLSEDGYGCSCPECPSNASYYWYKYNDIIRAFELQQNPKEGPTGSGTYRCRAVWEYARSDLSNPIKASASPPNITLIIVVVLLIIVGLVLAILGYFWWKSKKTGNDGQLYEDLPLKTQDKYEPLQRPYGAKQDAEYDTLQPTAPDPEKTDGGYQPLKKDQMKEGVYNTLEMEGGAGGSGGYEALKRGGEKQEVYHTLGAEGAADNSGGYEALKREGAKQEVYHTLGMEEAAGSSGGYEALKREGAKQEVYHTLGMEGTG